MLHEIARGTGRFFIFYFFIFTKEKCYFRWEKCLPLFISVAVHSEQEKLAIKMQKTAQIGFSKPIMGTGCLWVIVVWRAR